MQIDREDFLSIEAATRATHFRVKLGERHGIGICSVLQQGEVVNFTMLPPTFSWSAWQSQSDPEIARVIAEAFTQTAALMEEWAKDTGKLYREVLQ